ncbi:MAG: hypothetical protein K2K89_00550 [Ruminococcus sp.]|nr:hypothetical protein [Ruminococcus sp.]
MKNSLFKRVFATVASVPLALSQCLTYSSYAVTNDSVQYATGNTNSSGKEDYTLKDNFLYITPGEIESTWYLDFYTELVAIGSQSGGTEYSSAIDKETVADAILNRSGKYSEKAQMAIDMLGDDGIKYTVTNKGDITITVDVKNPDFSVFTDKFQKRIDDAFEEMKQEMKQKYEDAKAEMVESLGIAEEDLEDFNVTKEELLEKYPNLTAEDLDKYTFTKEDIAAKLDIPVENLENVDSIDNIDDSIADVKPEFNFDKVDVTGKLEIVLKGSQLKDGHTMDIQAKYVANTAVNGKKEFAVADVADFALAKVEDIRECANETISQIPDDKSKADAQAELDKLLDKAVKWINKAKDNQDRVLDKSKSLNRSTSAANMAGVIEAVNNYIENGKYSSQINKIENKVESIIKKDVNVPSSVTAIVKNSYVADIYDLVMQEINKIPVNIDIKISAMDIATFADNDLYNLTAKAENGTYTLTGDFPDDEVSDSYKQMIATLEVGDIYNTDANLAKVGLEIKRFPQTTTSSTSSTTTSTTTTSTLSTDDSGTTTNTTETSGSDSGTTTTTETSGSDSGTNTTTTETSGSDSGTTTTTETSGSDSGTNTTTTETSGSDSGTTTTTETSGSDSGTTTNTTETSGSGSDTGTTSTTTSGGGVLPGEVKRIFATVSAADDAEYGFYYSYDEEFHREQVKDVSIKVIYTDNSEEDINIAYDFASTPAETFEKYDIDFKYNAAIAYAGEDLTDSTGKVVLAKGEVLKTINDEEAGVVVYIGYRGDINLDYEVNAVDASQAQTYYATISTGKNTGKDSSNTVLSDSNLVTSPSSIYDQFAAFLGDVNMSNQEGEIINWLNGKKGRTIDAVDATGIQMAYAHLSLTDKIYEIGDKGLWDAVLSD